MEQTMTTSAGGDSGEREATKVVANAKALVARWMNEGASRFAMVPAAAVKDLVDQLCDDLLVTRAAHQAPCAECGFTGDRDLPTKVDALELENVRLSEERDHLLKWLETGLTFGKNKRAGDEREHIEWHAKCGCAFHPEPFPHVHPCSEEHRRPDLHAHPAPPTAPLSVEQITAMLPKTTDGTTTCPLCGKAEIAVTKWNRRATKERTP